MLKVFDKGIFYKKVRDNLFGGRLSQQQIDGIESIVNYWFENHSEKPNEFLAYILAQTKHETAGSMDAIEEHGKDSYFLRYDIRGNKRKALELGNKKAGDGLKYKGRGNGMITGYTNYLRQSEKFGIDLVNKPELMLNLDVATPVMIEGVIDGDFTGKKLSNYYKNGSFDAWNARRVLNAIVKEANREIVSYYDLFIYCVESATTYKSEPLEKPRINSLNSNVPEEVLSSDISGIKKTGKYLFDKQLKAPKWAIRALGYTSVVGGAGLFMFAPSLSSVGLDIALFGLQLIGVSELVLIVIKRTAESYDDTRSRKR